MSSQSFDDRLAPYLHDDETVTTRAVLDGGWLALTSRRVLVYAAAADRLQAVDRTEVVGVERATTSADEALARAPRLFVYGLVALGVGVGTRRVTAALAADVPGTASAPGVGSVLAMLDLFRTGMALLGRLALVAGALLVLAAVALGVHWYRSRRPTVVVETVEDPLRVPGTGPEVDDAVAALRAELGDRPDPADLLGP